MDVRNSLALFAMFAVGGCCFCARQPSPGPSKDHPASPLAAEAPAPGASSTLNAPPPIDGDGAAPGAGSAAGDPADALASPAAYTCPHHPKVMDAEPGDCPYCGMELEPTASKQMSPLRQRDDLPAGGPPGDAPDAEEETQDATDGAAQSPEDDDAKAADDHGEQK